MDPGHGRVALAMVCLLWVACRSAVPLKADDPTWFAETHAGKSMADVRRTIDQLLEPNLYWSRGPHGFVYQEGVKREGVSCSRIVPDSPAVRCDEEQTDCVLVFERNDREFGEDVTFEGLSHDDAQLLHAMMSRFCGWRDPELAAAEPATGG